MRLRLWKVSYESKVSIDIGYLCSYIHVAAKDCTEAEEKFYAHWPTGKSVRIIELVDSNAIL